MTELARLADKKPFMAMWASRPAGDITWLREVCMFIRRNPSPAGGTSSAGEARHDERAAPGIP